MKTFCWTATLILIICGGLARMAGNPDGDMAIFAGLLALSGLVLIEYVDSY